MTRYHGGFGQEFATSLVVENNGNVLVAGYSQGITSGFDWVILKYSPSGTPVWEKRYNGSANGDDRPLAMAVDRNGYVYVAGYAVNSGTVDDFLIIKFSPAGARLWAKSYNGPASSIDQASELVVDQNGNLFVAGKSLGAGTSNDYALIKYDSNGNQLWVRRYDGPGSNSDEPSDLALDGLGNLYLTGRSWGNNSWDFATLKYSSGGTLLWEKRFNQNRDADQATSLAVDVNGNVYITGKSWLWGTDKAYRFCTVKYNSSGTLLRTKYYQGLFYEHSLPVDLALDKSGNLFCCGTSWGAGTSYDLTTLKYDPNGNQIWAKRFSGPSGGGDFAAALAIDSNGNVHTTGHQYDKTTRADYDFATVKYSSGGSEVWSERYSGPAGIDQAVAITADLAGNIYVTGFSDGGLTSFDIVTIKYSPCTASSPKTGDANADGDLSFSDVVSIINYMYGHSNYPSCPANSNLCWLSGLLCRGDWNGDGKVSLADVIEATYFFFQKPGGNWEPVPSGACCGSVP